MKWLILVSLFCLLGPMMAVAKESTVYITPGGPVAMRQAASDEAATVGVLDPGVALTVVRLDTDDPYTLIRTPDKREGWVQDDRLSTKQSSMLSAANRPTTANRLNASTGRGATSWWAKVKGIFGVRLPRALNTPARIQLPEGSRQEVQQQYVQLQSAYVQLQHQHDRAWFVLGAVVLLVGMLLGMWITNWRARRRMW